MAVTASDVLELREAFRGARAQIDQSVDPIERDVGLASLRLEATETYKRVMSTGAGVTDDAIAPLKDYVASLSGGETAERAVALFDREAKQAISKASHAVNAALIGTSLSGGVALVIGVVAQVVMTAQTVGAALFLLVIGGGSGGYAAVRLIAGVGGGVQSGMDRGWEWADNLGKWSDNVLASARELEAKVWRATGATSGVPFFTTRVRRRAQIIAFLSSAAVAIGIGLIVIGFVRAGAGWYNKEKGQLVPTGTQPFTFTTP